MTYLMSDLHGCYDKFIKMLETIKFNDEDELYILGDVLDRGEDGIRILKYIMDRSNIQLLCGNHEYTALMILGNYIKNKDILKNPDFKEVFDLWLSDGGKTTWDGFMNLSVDEQVNIINYLKRIKFYRILHINQRKYFLSHTLPEKSGIRKLSDLTYTDLIMGEPDYDKRYAAVSIMVTGHTPTYLIDENYEGRIYSMNGHIAIDCGCVFKGTLGCLCLENLREFYVK